MNWPGQYKQGDTEVENFAHFIRKVPYSYATYA